MKILLLVSRYYSREASLTVVKVTRLNTPLVETFYTFRLFGYSTRCNKACLDAHLPNSGGAGVLRLGSSGLLRATYQQAVRGAEQLLCAHNM